MKSREPNKSKVGEELVLSSGVMVTVLPFPPGLLERINKDNPLPKPPKKLIETLGGKEEVDNESDPDYLEQKATIENKRNTLLGEAVIDLCIQCDVSKFSKEIKRIEKYTSEFPDDLDEKTTRFLQEYALRTRGDYENVITSAITQISISDTEVKERIESFQSEMAQSTSNGTKALGTHEVIGLAVESPQA